MHGLFLTLAREPWNAPLVMVEVPPVAAFKMPILEGLAHLEGTATLAELHDVVAAMMTLTPEQLARVHDPKRGKRTTVEYRMAWARTKLKAEGLIERVGAGTWALTERGRSFAAASS